VSVREPIAVLDGMSVNDWFDATAGRLGGVTSIALQRWIISTWRRAAVGGSRFDRGDLCCLLRQRTEVSHALAVGAYTSRSRLTLRLRAAAEESSCFLVRT
jgi:hypothetical protein